MRIAVYTCVIGGYDKIKSHYQCPGVDYYLVTDNREIKDAVGYKKVLYMTATDDHTKTSRYVKTHPHVFLPEYEYTIWMDGSMAAISDPRELLVYLNDNDICVLKPRDEVLSKRGDPYFEVCCIENEMRACTALGKDDPIIMGSQIQKYFNEGYPKNNGLVETGLMVRRNSEKIKKTMETWWTEIYNHSKRDQLSFGYSLWKNNIKFSYMPSLYSREMKDIIDFNIMHG